MIQSFDHVTHLLRVCAECLTNHGDPAAKSAKGAGRAAEQSACARAHSIYHQVAIIAVKRENETNLRMNAMQLAQCADQFFVFGRPIRPGAQSAGTSFKACKQSVTAL